MLRLSLLAALPATLALLAPTAPRRQTSLRDYTLDDAPIGGPLEPVANYILVKIDDGIDATKGGVFLPDQAKEKPSAGIVVAAGAGKAHPDTGVVVPNPVGEGDRVLYGKFDGTSVKYCGEDHQLIKDDDILLSWAGDASMTLGEVKCVADNVLVQVTKVEEETASGIALAAGVSEQTRTTSGVVVKTGTGRVAADGASVPVPVEVGESVKFKDYAGADIRLDGEDYIVVRVPDCLAKWTE
jgi:chaperonin GroES